MTRFTAFATHLALSFLIFLGLAYLVVFVWYPGILFDTDGGWRGMRIIVAVDLVLGPLLTLTVFKPGKPGLKTDLTLIGLLQAVCLAAGTWVVWSEKPEAIIYVDGRFQSVTADDFRDNGLPGTPDLDHLGSGRPRWVMVEVPEDQDDLARFRAEIFLAQVTPIAAVDRYVPFDARHPQFVNQPRSLSALEKTPEGVQAMAAFAAEHGPLENFDFYLFTTRYVFAYAAFDRETRELVGLLNPPKRPSSKEPEKTAKAA